jgi:hypothetical protein
VSTVKVGDELAFRGTYGRTWNIHRVTEITPTGRIKCGSVYTLNPNLTIRGARKWGPYEGQLVTPEIRERVVREDMLEAIDRQKLLIPTLTTDQLLRIVAILEEKPNE